MKYHDTINYPVPREELFRFFTDPDFFVRKYVAQGATNVRVTRSETAGSCSTITVTRDVPVEVPIPSFARALVPSTITLVQTDSWDRTSCKGSLQIEFKGMPVRLNCEMTLQDRAGGSVEELAFDIRVSVPLLGGKLEELLARDLRLKFQRDTEASLGIIKGDA
ncbi:MAG: DUF2505 domain-containing protein [bacterium]|nr:DUF2505 domain-containing protein [bacterium]